jgi:hypothetical protein
VDVSVAKCYFVPLIPPIKKGRGRDGLLKTNEITFCECNGYMHFLVSPSKSISSNFFITDKLEDLRTGNKIPVLFLEILIMDNLEGRDSIPARTSARGMKAGVQDLPFNLQPINL